MLAETNFDSERGQLGIVPFSVKLKSPMILCVILVQCIFPHSMILFSFLQSSFPSIVFNTTASNPAY